MSTVIIGCKLPHGLKVQGSMGQEIHLNGMNTSLVAGGFGLTHVDESEAAYIGAVYAEHAAFQAKSIFTVGSDSVADTAALGRELSDEKTGFEGLNPDAPAPGLKPENEKQVDAAKTAVEKNPRPSKAPASKADKAAAKALQGEL